MEKRYYIVNPDKSEKINQGRVHDISDNEFISEAENQGTVFTEKYFVYAFNHNEIDIENSYIRIIMV